jgi:predicted Zn-ribbon and HTH transcriptional regulator
MGDRKIPPEEIVANAIKKVLSSRKIVESQEELALIVEKELKKINKDYVVRPPRVKRIALEIQEIEVKAKTRKSIGLQKIDKCPICGSEVKEMKVKNLLGKEIVVGYRCSKCGYESDLEAFLPMKYIFVWKY